MSTKDQNRSMGLENVKNCERGVHRESPPLISKENLNKKYNIMN